MSHLKWSALAYRGDYVPAWASSTLVCETMDDVGDPEATGRAKWEKGYVLIRLGRYQEAAETLNQAETLGRTVKNPITRVISLHELALLDLLQDRLEEALTKAQDLEKMLLAYRTTQYLSVPSHNVATQAYLQKAEQSSGTDKDYWLRKAGVACARGLRQTKACFLVRPEAWRLNGIYQWLSGKPKSAKKCWQKALDIAEQTGQRHDSALILREIGNRLHDKQSLERAELIRTQLRADLG